MNLYKESFSLEAFILPVRCQLLHHGMETRQEQSSVSVSTIKIPQKACIHKPVIGKLGNSHPLTAVAKRERDGDWSDGLPRFTRSAARLLVGTSAECQDQRQLAFLLVRLLCVCRVCFLSNRIRREGRRLTARKLLFYRGTLYGIRKVPKG